MHCRSLLCVECIENHPSHDTIFDDENCVIHILKYAKTKLRLHYWNTINDIKNNFPSLRSQLVVGRKRIKEMLSAIMNIINKTKTAISTFETLRDDLSGILAKIEFSAYFENELKTIENESKKMEDALSSFNLLGLIKILTTENCASRNPRLEKEDLQAVEKAYNEFKNHPLDNWKKIIDEIQELGKDASKMSYEVKVAGKALTKPIVFKPFAPIKSNISYDTLLKDAIAKNEIDNVYKLFDDMRKEGTNSKILTNMCIGIPQGLSLLFSYASQNRYENKEDNLMKYLEDMYSEIDPKKNKDLYTLFDQVFSNKIVEINNVKKILKEKTLRDQKKLIDQLIAITPEKQYAFIKTMFTEYLNNTDLKIQLGLILKKSNSKYTNILLNIEGILKLIHYSTQIPMLELELDGLLKKINVPKMHIDTIRLYGYGEIQDWKNVVRFLTSTKTKFTPEYLARYFISFNNKEFAIESIKKIEDYEKQVELYMDIEAYQEAADAAVLSKKDELLDYLKSRSNYCEYYIKEAKSRLVNIVS